MAVAGGITVPLFVRFSFKKSKAMLSRQSDYTVKSVKLGSKDTFSRQLENSFPSVTKVRECHSPPHGWLADAGPVRRRRPSPKTLGYYPPGITGV